MTGCSSEGPSLPSIYSIEISYQIKTRQINRNAEKPHLWFQGIVQLLSLLSGLSSPEPNAAPGIPPSTCSLVSFNHRTKRELWVPFTLSRILAIMFSQHQWDGAVWNTPEGTLSLYKGLLCTAPEFVSILYQVR